MAAIFGKLHGMTSGVEKYFFAAAGFCLLLAAGARAQSLPLTSVGTASNVSTVTYFEAPHEQLVEYKLSGAQVTPLPGMMFDFTNMKIEKFAVDGKLEVTVQAPQCVYAPGDGVASSAGHMKLESGDGNFRVEGDGFLWRQGQRSLNISNNVHTVIKLGITNLIKL
jgi:hypothetical protein